MQYWRLTELDVNKDLPVDSSSSMHIEPKIEFKMLDTTLRLYVKVISGETLLRLEEMRVFNQAFYEAIASLRYGIMDAAAGGGSEF